jgi:hypothetical protein
MLRFADKTLAQLRILGSHTHGTGVEVAHPHHNAAQRHQRCRGEPKLFGTKQRGDDNITPGLQLAIGFNDDSGAEIIEQQGLVSLGEAEFPGQTGMFNARLRRRARATVVPADQNHIGVGFSHTRRDRADADFRNQFNADSRVVIRVLKVVNQLRQVFDRVNIVMRRG